MKNISTHKNLARTLIGLVIVFQGLAFAGPIENLKINRHHIKFESTTNGTYDIQWAHKVKGPWHDTWEEFIGIPGTGGEIKVDAPHFFRVVYRNLPDDQIGTYLGYRWHCYRTKWDIGDEWIQSLPVPRDGFNYFTDGRGPNITTHENDEEWTDYTVEFDLELLGVDPTWNPWGIPSDYRNANFFFRLQSMSEDWHEGHLNAYYLQLKDEGTHTLYRLGRVNDYGYYGGGTSTFLDVGTTTNVTLSATNRVKVSCIGNELKAWINGDLLVSYEDTSAEAFSHGGIGFRCQWESMGRFRDMTITHIEAE